MTVLVKNIKELPGFPAALGNPFQLALLPVLIGINNDITQSTGNDIDIVHNVVGLNDLKHEVVADQMQVVLQNLDRPESVQPDNRHEEQENSKTEKKSGANLDIFKHYALPPLR